MNDFPIMFHFPQNEKLAESINKTGDFLPGDLILRQFPDGESYVRIKTDVAQKAVFVIASLDNPNPKMMPLLFICYQLKELGAKTITLVAPYLSYLRQDKIFHQGEALTSKIFGELLSTYIDHLVTIDPHLHRIKKLEEIYSIKTTVLHAFHPISSWIKQNVPSPLLIGPDEESRQWTEEIAKLCHSPYIVLNKERQGDHQVTITFPDLSEFKNFNPVLIDDVISSGTTMLEACRILYHFKMPAPVCLAVHGIFALDSYQKLQNSFTSKIVTCNTIGHPSNQIDISPLLLSQIRRQHS